MMYQLHGWNDSHIFRITDDTGMLQHAKYGVPDPTKGYTTDDNARALIMAVLLYGQHPRKRYEKLLYRYMAFLLNAQNEDGWFKNFMSYDRRFLEDRGSQDCFGRCLWALGFAISNKSVPQNIKHIANHLLSKGVLNCNKLDSPRAKAYSIIGLQYLYTKQAEEQIYSLASSLAAQYEKFKSEDWHWFENIIAYSNAVMPWAMLSSYKIIKDESFKEIGLESLRFLESKTFRDGFFKPVGCNGWLIKGKVAAEYDEQPVEACEMLLAFLEAYEITGEQQYLIKARKCLEWYKGNNSKGICMIDPETGGCYDGITPDGVNLNQGAESLVSYWISKLVYENVAGGK